MLNYTFFDLICEEVYDASSQNCYAFRRGTDVRNGLSLSLGCKNIYIYDKLLTFDEEQQHKTFSQQVRLTQPVADINMGGDMYEQIIVNKTSYELTRKHLPRFDVSPLKQMFLKDLTTIPKLRLYLFVRTKEGGNLVTRIGIGSTIEDSVDRDTPRMREQADKPDVEKSIEEYFVSIGYPSTSCTANAEIVEFVKRLHEDIPITKNYLKLSDEEL